MAFASLDDVKRILNDTSTDAAHNARLQASLDAVNSWAEQRLSHTSIEGANVETYMDVVEDATLYLPGGDLTVTAVKLFEYPSSQGVTLAPIGLGLGHGYDITDDGSLILRPVMFSSPFEGATSGRFLRTYAKVEVYYQGTGIVPRAVTEGVAFLAAGYFKDAPRALAGIMSEKIGDYSYTLGDRSADAGVPGYVAQAEWFLTPFLKRSRVQVT